jgi:hypothetical protein
MEEQVKAWANTLIGGLDKELPKDQRLMAKAAIKLAETVIIDIHRIANALEAKND